MALPFDRIGCENENLAKIEQIKKDAVNHPHNVFNISLISSPLLFNFMSVIRGLAESVVTYGMHVTLYKLPGFQGRQRPVT
jgi:hypothetical protein